MTVSDFIKAMQVEFGPVGYRATRFADGLVIDKDYPRINETGNWHNAIPALKPYERKRK
jgi:hypothetical protein